MLGVNDKNAIVDRLMEIVTAGPPTVQTKSGRVEDEVTGDKNSLTAAKSVGGLHVKFLKNHNDDTGVIMLNVQEQNAILDRLMQIVAKQTVTVQTKTGSVADEVIADKN